MYEAHWGLTRKAFSTVGDSGWYHLSPTHDEAQARLDYLVAHRRRLAILAGPHGVGKSMTLNYFSRQFARRPGECHGLSLLGLGLDELVERLALRLGATPAQAARRATAWQAIHDRLAVNRFQEIPTVLLFDDAHQAESDVLLAIQRLVQVEAGPSPFVTVVLAATSGHVARLGQPLQELSELKIELELWDRWQTASFLEWSLEAAGATVKVFESDGKQRVFELARGNPRRTVQLAELALTAAAAQGTDYVDSDLVDAAAEQLMISSAMALDARY